MMNIINKRFGGLIKGTAVPDIGSIINVQLVSEVDQQLNEAGFAGHNDWRFPNNEELSTLILSRETSKRLYLDPIFGSQSCFWSSTTRGHHVACYVDFFYGGVYRFEENYVNHSVRAVRGEMRKTADKQQPAA